MNRVYESMTRIIYVTDHWGRVTIRVWRDEPTFTVGADQEVIEHFKVIVWPLPIESFQAFGEAVVRHLSLLDRIAAIEILNEYGDGGLLYPDWS